MSDLHDDFVNAGTWAVDADHDATRSSGPYMNWLFRKPEGVTVATKKKHTRRSKKAKQRRQSQVAMLKEQIDALRSDVDRQATYYEHEMQRRTQGTNEALAAAEQRSLQARLTHATASRDAFAQQIANDTRRLLADALVEVNRTFAKIMERV